MNGLFSFSSNALVEVSFPANSKCFYRTQGQRSAGEADLCFQKTPEGHRGSGRTVSLLLRWREKGSSAWCHPEGCGAERRIALHGCSSQSCRSSPTERHWASGLLLSWTLILTSPLMFSSAFFSRIPTEAVKIQVCDAPLISLTSSGHRH